jgi:adenylate kinase
MAPTPDDVINSLKSTVDKLEARVAELEGKLKGSAGSSSGSSSSSGSDGMRMILIGPPGAGKSALLPLRFSRHIGFAA